MPEQRTHPVWLDDVESPPMDVPRKRLCIVSGDALQSREFIAALQTAVGPNEEIEIIRDRRQGGPGPASGRPPLERRRLPHVDALLKMDGYAIVPLPTNQPRRVPESPIATSPIQRQPAEPRPAERPRFERPSFDDDDDAADADERELERILQFKRRHQVRLGPLLVLTALVAVLAILLLLQLPAVTTLLSQIRPPSTPPVEKSTPPVEKKSEPETPSPLRESSVSLPPAGAESPEPERLREADSTPRAQTGPAPRAETGPVRRPEPDPVPRPQPSAVLRAQPNSAPRPQAGMLASVPPSRVSSRPSGPVLRGEASRFPGLPRVELVRNSVPTPEGKADSYVVRVADPAGRPLSGADVLLLAGMADGTVESVMLDAGPEPGTYTGTSRPSRSAPVDLRVRMTMSDKRIEIPLKP